MDALILTVLTIIEIIVFTTLGMALTPGDFLKCDGKEKTMQFMFAPVLGFAIHTATISILSHTIGYNFAICFLVLIIEIAAIIIGRKKLWFDKDVCVLVYLAAVIVGVIIMEYGIMPKMIDGGLYFSPSAYDHARIAIVDSIVSNGFPVLSPWVTNKGEMVQMGYHFGMHIVSAQITTLSGVDSFLAATSLTGTIFYIAALCVGGMSLVFGKSKRVLLFVVQIAFMINIQYGVLKDVTKALTVDPDIFGFWTFFDNTIWGPHHTIAGVIVLYISWLLTRLLQTAQDKKKMKVEIAVIIALSAAAAAVCSIYAGALALLFVGMSALIYILFNREYRQLVQERLSWALIALALSGLACLPFGLCLAENATGNSYLEPGIMPALLHTDGLLLSILSIFTVLLVLLPIRLGFQYILGFIAFFMPGLNEKKWEIGFYRTIIVISILVPLFVHSTIYSNDFGWRSGYSAYALLICMGAVLLDSLYTKISEWAETGRLMRGVKIAYLLLIVLLVAIGVPETLVQITPANMQNHEMHVEYAGVVKGWETIRNHTNKNDIVLCNPTAYGEINPPMGDEIPNYAFSYYSKRYSLLGDVSYAKTSGFGIGEDNIYALKDRIQDFYSGNPSKEDVDYFYDTEKVRAILVTPQDGLYTSEGNIREKYPVMIEGEYYKAYFAK